MNNLVGQPSELKMTVKITRKATGKVEEYQLTGNAVKKETISKEASNGCHTQSGGA